MYMLYSSVNVANCSGVSAGGPAGTGVGAVVTIGVTGATVDATGVTDGAGVTGAEGLGGGIIIIHGSALGAACVYPVSSVTVVQSISANVYKKLSL
ncbi:hypothetical protein HA402_000542 [Bradysia odoriphaga]|nr:hypothetical protein HA402_000542 [Bradysia odoriphaga]